MKSRNLAKIVTLILSCALLIGVAVGISVSADEERGELLTPPLTFFGSELVLNYSTSAAGYLQVEVLDDLLKVIPGFSRDDFAPRHGDEIAGRMKWNSGSSLADLAGKVIHLRFIMQEADLYSLRFC